MRVFHQSCIENLNSFSKSCHEYNEYLEFEHLTEWLRSRLNTTRYLEGIVVEMCNAIQLYFPLLGFF